MPDHVHSLTMRWPTCRVEGCDVTAHRLIDVYEAVECPVVGERLTWKGREGVCLLHDDNRPSVESASLSYA